MTRDCFYLMVAVGVLAGSSVLAATRDLGNGYADHGVATPVSCHRGTVATVDAEGHRVVLSWLMDHRGCYELLLVDVETGAAEEHPISFPLGDSPFASILSRANKYYTHFGSHFIEFDPARREFTFCQKTSPQMAMSMTEDDQGVIWSATYPQSGVVSFNPQTRALRDYGHVYRQDWSEYPRSIAVDDASSTKAAPPQSASGPAWPPENTSPAVRGCFTGLSRMEAGSRISTCSSGS
jgi:hypothetical protein